MIEKDKQFYKDQNKKLIARECHDDKDYKMAVLIKNKIVLQINRIKMIRT